MIDTKFRKIAQPGFDSIAKGFVALKLTPTTISIFAFFIGIIASVFLSQGYILVSLVLLWASGLFDVIDGTVARMTNKSSKLGAFYDLIFDRMVESSIILGFYFFHPEYALAYLIFFIAVIFNFSTFMIAGALFKNESSKSMHYDIGLAERTETFIIFTLMMIFHKYLFWILMFFNIIIFITGGIRFFRITKNSSNFS
ncbi:MAG: CDP-alcohol phosphatidyltransferase family protein [Clostridiaceae bacterium]